MKATQWNEVLLSGEANEEACAHLLQHYKKREMQEDLCFGLWTPSTGSQRETAIVTDILIPREGERGLHGNASFSGSYLARATRAAIAHGRGLVFMHSHPSPGWQDMSNADIHAEQGRIADTARATGKPLVGMTVGTDEYWSARFWKEGSPEVARRWCKKVRVLDESRLTIWRQPTVERRGRRKQRRTVDSWGERKQRDLEALRIGIVGLGSVGSVVAEGLARIGVREIVLIDDDIVEEHNLDRLLNAHAKDVGRPKTDIAERAIRKASTASSVVTINHRKKVQDREAYASARDCDILVSCVDSPVARDLLNRTAYRDGIPVVDGGVEIRKDPRAGNMNAARWRAHVAGPYSECLRCRGQYTSSDVMLELDGSLRNPNYIKADTVGGPGAENVFCFSLATGSELLNMAVRLVVADAWWPTQAAVERNFVTGRTKSHDRDCNPTCTIKHDVWKGETAAFPDYLITDETDLGLASRLVRRLREVTYQTRRRRELR